MLKNLGISALLIIVGIYFIDLGRVRGSMDVVLTVSGISMFFFAFVHPLFHNK